jgi:plastocyanin
MQPMQRTLLLLGACALAASAQAGALKVTVLDKEGKPVPDAIVVLAPASPGTPKPLPTRVTISQEKMRFVPAVSLVAVGTQATFVNNDPWEHHVRASAAGIQNVEAASTGGLELRLEGKAAGKPAAVADGRFDKAGPVLLGCHLHASMKAHIYVSDTPWAAVSDETGQASFEAVPEGPVRIRVWQADQLLDLPPQQMVLTAAPATASVQLQVVPRRRRI